MGAEKVHTSEASVSRPERAWQVVGQAQAGGRNACYEDSQGLMGLSCALGSEQPERFALRHLAEELAEC